jgi:serine/threonine protein kinase/tetratricopeptide (TPR) repeat protein
MNSQDERKKELFLNAVDLPSAAARHAYLAAACAGDDALRREIEDLLGHHECLGSFLQAGGGAVAALGDTDLAGEQLGAVIGPYKLMEQIGEGGMGLVFVAEQQQPVRRKVALKVIKPGMDSKQVIARFEAERQALALMDHPHIAKVHDGGTTPSGRPYFVMELVKGVPMTQFCDDHRLTPRQRLELFVPVCQAVQHAHQKGIIHRDLKPSNVLVTSHDGTPVVKVIDFGVAKAIGQQLTDKTVYTQLTQLIGTPLYMSPEQAGQSGLDIDTRSDIYSLGVLLYELLTGTTPFDKERLQKAGFDEICRIIREEEPPRPSTRLSESKDTLLTISAQRRTEPAQLPKLLRGELDWIVMKCLEKDRNRRYETASDLAMDVRRFLTDEPVQACPPSAGYRLRKFAGKYRRVLVIAAAFVALLASATVVSTWLAVRARMAERTAGEQRDKAIAEKQRGDIEAAITTAINDFLQKDLLGQSDIGNQPGDLPRNKNITVRELLDRAAQGIDAKFPDQPRTEAAIRFTLGKAYIALGEYAEAHKHLERCVALRKELQGPRHRDTLDAMSALAIVHWRRGQLDQAEKLYEEVLAGFRELGQSAHPDALSVVMNQAILANETAHYKEAEAKLARVVDGLVAQLGSDHPTTLWALSNLAATYSAQGDYARAEALERQVVAGFRALPQFGPDHPKTLFAMNNLATGYLLQRQYDQAQPLFEEILRARRDKLEPGHPDTLTTMNDLAVVYQGLRLSDKADPLFQEALDAATVKPGPDHPLTLKIKNCLATLRSQQGRFEEAEALFGQVLQSRRKTLPADHPDLLTSIHNLGVYYRMREQYAKAEPLLVEAVERARTTLTIRHPSTQQWLNSLAFLYGLQKKPERAEPLLRELADYQHSNAGAESVAYARCLEPLAQNLMQQGKYVLAEPLARECLGIRLAKEPDAWTTFYTQALLGSALARQQRFTDAEPHLRQGYEGMKQRAAQIPPEARIRLTKVLQWLVHLYEAWDRPDEAAKWRKELEALEVRASQ